MKHVLDKAVYEDQPMGKLAISLVGDEPAHELFMLLMNITQVAMAGKVSYEWEGQIVPMDVPTDPIFFEKPFYPRTMEIVGRLVEKDYLEFYAENEHGIAYTLNVPDEGRGTWIESITDEIIGFQKIPSTAEKPFTPEEQIRVMNAVGIPVGGTFDFDLQGGFHLGLTLTPRGVCISDPNVDRALVKTAMCFWQLQAFGGKHGLGKFSNPTPLSEMAQIKPVMEELGRPIYNTMPVDEVISRMEGEFRKFWANFKQEVTQQ